MKRVAQKPAVTFRLEKKEINRLRVRARQNERTVSQEVRLMVKQALELDTEAA